MIFVGAHVGKRKHGHRGKGRCGWFCYDIGNQSIPAAGDGLDHMRISGIITQGPAQSGYRVGESLLRHVCVRPDFAEDFLFGEDFAGAPRQTNEDIEDLGLDRYDRVSPCKAVQIGLYDEGTYLEPVCHKSLLGCINKNTSIPGKDLYAAP